MEATLQDGIRDLGRARGLDDFLEETAALEAGVQAGRRVFSAADLDRFATATGAEVIDGTKGERIVVPREPEIRRLNNRLVESMVVAHDQNLSPDALIAREKARHLDDGGQPRPDGWAEMTPADRLAWFRAHGMDGSEEAAAGAKRVHGAGGSGDKGPKNRRGGGGEKMKHENWDHQRSVGGRPRKGRDPRDRFSVRAEPVTRATIATTGKNESDFLAEAAKLVAMAQTGAQADELMRAVIALAGTQAAA
jgi:hypothetical protein